jgi:hypothetical protein
MVDDNYLGRLTTTILAGRKRGRYRAAQIL